MGITKITDLQHNATERIHITMDRGSLRLHILCNKLCRRPSNCTRGIAGYSEERATLNGSTYGRKSEVCYTRCSSIVDEDIGLWMY